MTTTIREVNTDTNHFYVKTQHMKRDNYYRHTVYNPTRAWYEVFDEEGNLMYQDKEFVMGNVPLFTVPSPLKDGDELDEFLVKIKNLSFDHTMDHIVYEQDYSTEWRPF